MKAYLPVIIFILVLAALDLYVYKSLRIISSGWTKGYMRSGVSWLYWLTSIGAHGLIIYAFLTYRQAQDSVDYYFFFMGFGLLLMLFIPKLVILVFHIFDDLIHLFRKVATYFIQISEPGTNSTTQISRWQFLTRVGWALAAIPFLGIIYGMAKGRYSYRVERARLSSGKLPGFAEGLRIVHISDIHIGSFFNNYEAVQRGIDMINDLKPDLILFTGDMVNNYAKELEGWEPVLSKLNARLGKYSILGNHDYGDYVQWQSATEKAGNLELLKQYHQKLGFRMLLNERVEVNPEGVEPLEIIGIENWGLGGFSQYGKLEEALRGSDPARYRVLLSHDPSHWDAQVLRKTNIDLTLSGHTHGMQFGVEIPGIIKWSPVKYRYPRWGGLYSEGEQHLYVNRGFGYIGFPGRVGMPPEITLIELSKA